MGRRGRLRWVATVLPLWALLGGPVSGAGAGPDIGWTPGNPARGRDLFVEKGCLSCHAVRGAGGTIGPDLAATVVRHGTAVMAAAMLNHAARMNGVSADEHAARAALDPAETDDVLAYLLTISFAPEPGAVENGRALFIQKGCVKCHWSTGGDPSSGPPLGRAMLSASPSVVAQDMWNHATQMTAAMRQLQVPRSRFAGHEMADLLAFLGGPTAALSGGEAVMLGDAVAGSDVFRSKGCARCHRERHTGEADAPNLLTGSWYMTATEIAGAMWNHGPAIWEGMQDKGVAPFRFEGHEMPDVIAYLYLARSTTPSVAAVGHGRP